MKTLLVFTISLCLGVTAFGQEPRKVYLGFGSGLNYPTGVLGANIEFQFVRNVSVYGAFGLGSWGGKAGTGIRVYPTYPDKFAFSLSYSYASGIPDIDLDMEDEFVEGGSGISSVNFKLLPSSTVNISVLRHWLVGKSQKNRIGIEAGYAIPTSSDRYEAGATLTRDGRTFMDILQPGGFLLGTVFSLGL